MSQQTIGVGTVANDGTGDQPRTAFTKVNANFTELYGGATTAPLGILYVDPFGAKGDGVTDDTAAIQAAENARTAGQTLKFTPGKTYVVETAYNATVGAAANLLQTKVAGAWDLSGVTLKYGSATAVTTGSDGGALGMVLCLAAPFRIIGAGTLDGNSLVRSPLCFLQTQSGFEIDVTLQNLRETTLSVWDGTQCTVSVDASGVAISGRAKNISGILRRPQCPVTTDLSTITGHNDLTALLFGHDVVNSNHTSTAIVRLPGVAGAPVLCHSLLGLVGVVQFVPGRTQNTAFGDWSCTDLNNNVLETQGANGNGAFALGGTASLGHAVKNGATTGWYDYNVVSASTTPPTVLLQGRSAAQGQGGQNGFGYLAGQFLLGNTKPSATASFTPDLSKGNDFVVPASGAALTINAVTSAPTNPIGLSLTQVFSVTVQRLSGGALTTSWNAAYHLAGAWTDPSGANTQRSIWFRYDIGAGVAYEISRSAADVTV